MKLAWLQSLKYALVLQALQIWTTGVYIVNLYFYCNHICLNQHWGLVLEFTRKKLFFSICPCLKVMCLSITSDFHRPRDHVEASSESVQPSPAAFPTHWLFAPAGTSTNTASRPAPPCPCSGNWAPCYGSQPYSRTPSCNCYSHIKASPTYFTTHIRSSSNGLNSATVSSTNGARLGSPTCRSHTSNSASNDGPHTTIGTTTPEPCTNTGAPTYSGTRSLPIPPPSQPSVSSADHHPSPGVQAHPWSSSGSSSKWAPPWWGLSTGDGGAGGLSGAGGTV